MAMIRTKKQENPFVQIDKLFLSNDDLSWKAKGVLAYILSKPDNWTIRMKDLQNKATDGETAVRSAIKELREKRYINRFRERDEKGRLGDYIYEVYERPEYNPNFNKNEEKPLKEKKKQPERDFPEQGVKPKRDFPEQGNPEQGNPEQGNHVHNNNDFNNNDFNNNDYSNNHHQREFTDKQMSLINKFAVQNDLKTDDDDFIKLLDKLKEYKPNSIKYIAKVYESIINKNDTYSINHNVKDKGKKLFKDWEEKVKKIEEEEKKKAPEQLEREQKELEDLLNQYK